MVDGGTNCRMPKSRSLELAVRSQGAKEESFLEY